MTASATSAGRDAPETSLARKLRRRRQRRRGLSIQSKLLLMLLATSVLSAAVVGVIGFRSGRQSLEAAALDRLTQIRSAQARQLQAQFKDLKDTLIIYTHDTTCANAIGAFAAGLDQLGDAPIDPARDQALRSFYQNQVGKREEAETGTQVQINSLLPNTNAQKYLQAHYTVPFTDRAAALKVDDAGDGSAWTAANARYNDFFRTIVSRSKFEDALLLDTRGNVVYSAYKNVDLGTNIFAGPYRDSNLAEAYRTTMNARAVDYVGVTDFAEYEPAGQPTAWLSVPIDGPDRRVGVLALEFPIVKVNRLMTVDRDWETAGMGDTGETFLVGPDNLMRSDSRLFLQDPEAYQRDVVRAGTPPDVAAKAIRQHGTTLVQPVASESVRLAAQGQRGTLITRDYLGRRTLQAYAPVDLPGLRWSLVAKINAGEAFAPVAAFTQTLVVSTAVIIFLVCVAAMLLARIFVRPVRQLMAGAHRISAGDYDIDLPVLSRDELGDLTVAFNDMGRNLTLKQELINEQRRENDRLLLSVMPEPAVQRYREGEESIAIEHPNLTVIAAETDHLDELSAELACDESLSVVNKLVRQFDAAAETTGVEPVQTMHNWYLASCGLSVPRLDSARRAVDFAAELQRIVERFNSETGNALTLRVGIDTGPVTSGLIGRSNLAYDMWGSAVNFAYHLKNDSPQPGIYVTSRVYEAVGDSHEFTAAGSITVDGVEQTIWRLAEGQP
ncbi:adenylate/guanylate cyclase domain-containing protein [Mycobacterium sp. pUA109]|uniref:adenylate/guanylate cyclase domain-containing protein n=1 Tax=Mycobacterium sp. pUA109 TaxID=3238982 RepID=UPI00351BDDB1